MNSKRRSALIRLSGALLLFCLVMGLAACGKAPVATKRPPVTSEPKVSEAPKTLWPLTGLEAPTDAPVGRYPLSVKIENLKAARPQTGINSADIVYETMVEGGITRFNCLFDSKVPATVGPVRSARLSDFWIVPQYQGLFFYSGANSQVTSGLKSRGLTKLEFNKASSIYRRITSRKAPHNLYLSLSQAYDKAQALGVTISADGVRPGPAFGDIASDETTAPATSLEIPFSTLTHAAWTWDAASGHYLRSTDGAVHIDAADGSRLWADNVVVMWAVYTPQSKVDAAGNGTYDVTMGGTGKAAIFRDGVRIDATWSATADTPPTFTDAAGKPVTLKAGRTWFEVPQTSVTITSQ